MPINLLLIIPRRYFFRSFSSFVLFSIKCCIALPFHVIQPLHGALEGLCSEIVAFSSYCWVYFLATVGFIFAL